jgi:hypothetical protein
MHATTQELLLNFNNYLSTAAVFLDIKKAFDKTWHPGLLYKLYELQIFDKFNQAYQLLSIPVKIQLC